MGKYNSKSGNTEEWMKTIANEVAESNRLSRIQIKGLYMLLKINKIEVVNEEELHQLLEDKI